MATIILAPHVDDEIIGCYTLLKNELIDKVIYFYDLDDVRKAEALKIAELFEHEVSFKGYEEKIDIHDTLYIPSKFDYHPHHWKVYQYGRDLPNRNSWCYSVEKNLHCDLLSVRDSTYKLKALDSLIPTQRDLWRYNAKYILFELIYQLGEDIGKEFYSNEY